MAGYKNIKQNIDSCTVPNKNLINYAMDERLNKKDFRVLLLLMSRIDGDRYTSLNLRNMSEILDLEKKEIKKSLNNLEFCEIIQRGSDKHTDDGYMFLRCINAPGF